MHGIKSIGPRGERTRSIIEATWLYIFDTFGIKYSYERSIHKGYIADVNLHFKKKMGIAEIKGSNFIRNVEDLKNEFKGAIQKIKNTNYEGYVYLFSYPVGDVWGLRYHTRNIKKLKLVRPFVKLKGPYKNIFQLCLNQVQWNTEHLVYNKNQIRFAKILHKKEKKIERLSKNKVISSSESDEEIEESTGYVQCHGMTKGNKRCRINSNSKWSSHALNNGEKYCDRHLDQKPITSKYF